VRRAFAEFAALPAASPDERKDSMRRPGPGEEGGLARVWPWLLVLIFALVIGGVVIGALQGLDQMTQGVATALAVPATGGPPRPTAPRPTATSPAAPAAVSPVSSPTVRAASPLEVQVAKPRPKSFDTQTVTGRLVVGDRAVAGARCRLDVRFRSGVSTWEGVTKEDGRVEISFDLVGAAIDYPVQVDMECLAGGTAYKGSAQFIPGS
jgi:hypothetical protein